MFVAMNRFRIHRGRENAFEAVWKGRKSHLDDVPGFRSFHLLKGHEIGDVTLYASHSVWESEAAFIAWTKSEAFRSAHKGAKSSEDLYDGPPVLECFSSVEGA